MPDRELHFRFRRGAQGVRPRSGIVVTDCSGPSAPLPIMNFVGQGH
jgi:hypothetical protein